MPAALGAAQEADSGAQIASARDQFQRTCALCHGSNAEGTDRGPALANNRRLRSIGANEIADVIKSGQGGMPSFPLPPSELHAMAVFIKSLNATAFEMPPAGDVTAGEHLFFGAGNCSECHMVMGRGGTNGPDLSEIGRQLSVAELGQWLENPGARSVPGYSVVNVQLQDGTSLRGFARGRGAHSLQLQTFDGRFHLLGEGEYTAITDEKPSFMPPFAGTPEERRDLTAFLSRMGGIRVGPAPAQQQGLSQNVIDAILSPASGNWPTYSGSVNGNRYSALSQINRENVGKLRLDWSYSVPYFGLETTPLVLD
ncbi:MAG: c-type cytochrome, partial [Candidatus Acidiferrales bacterium]